MSLSRAFTFASVLLFAAVPLFAATHRVSTPDELAALRLAPGDVVTVADGTRDKQTFTFRGQGTAEKPITLRAENPGQVVLTGKSHLVIDGEWLVVEGLLLQGGGPDGDGIALKGSHNRLTECAVDGGTYKFFVHLYGTHHRVDHCYFAGKTSESPTLQIEVAKEEPNYHHLDHNHFGSRPPLGKNGGETMRIGYSHQSMNNSRSLVEENLFERCDGEIEIISSKSCENTYRANTFLDCDGMLTLRHGNRCVVDGNFFLGHHKKGSGGIRIIGEDHVVTNNYIEGVTQGGFWITSGVPNSQLAQYFQAKRCIIAFNTVADSGGPYLDLSAGLGGSGRTLKPEAITVENNLFALGKGGALLKGTEGENWRWSGNIAAPTKIAHAGVRLSEINLQRGTDGLLRPVDRAVAAGYGRNPQAPQKYRPLTVADVGPAWRH